MRGEASDLSAEFGLPSAAMVRLLNCYGSRITRLLSLMREEPELARPVVSDSPLLAVQVAYATDFEMARIPEDVLSRPSPLALEQGRGLRELEGVAALMARRVDRSDDCRECWRQAYLARYFTP